MLAIDGGEPVRKRPFPVYNTIGDEEKQAVMDVLDCGVLSKYLGKWGSDFYGGPRVQMLEREWGRYFGTEYAVAMNSATSCLYSAVGAVGVEPGDEVIVTPYSMSASVTGVEIYGGRPVFADIDPETFCITPKTIRPLITQRTKAIIVVDLFGHPCDIDGIMNLAEKEGIYVIEDAAQAPGSRYNNKKYAGTCADIGVFSLNYHKTIHCGEGGVAVTDHDELATRLDLIRNHGESVVSDMGRGDLYYIKGYNFRMTEIEAAIASEQLKKLENLVWARRKAAQYLTIGLADFSTVLSTPIEQGVESGYYVYPILLKPVFASDRDYFVDALVAEGIPVTKGYVRPLYHEPLFEETLRPDVPDCPVVEDIQRRLITTNVCHYNVTREDLDDVLNAFHKVFKYATLLGDHSNV